MSGWRALLLVLCVGLWSAAGWARTEGSLAPGLVNPGHLEAPKWFKDSFLDIREDIHEAAAEDRRVLLYFYQDGCPYCRKLLNDNFGQREIAAKTRGHFDVIAINIWGDREVIGLGGEETTEKDYAKGLRVMFTPTLLFLDEDGGVVLRINGYYPPHRFEAALDFVAGHHEQAGSFRDYLARHMPEPATGRLHIESGYLQPPYRLADRLASSKRPVLVIFEQRQCRACDELHLDILRRPMSRELLAAFDVAVVDMWSKDRVQTPAGQSLETDAWARQLDIKYSPSLVFFDADGREVFRSEGYLKAFHIQSVLDYVASGAYRTQPEFQRYIDARADALRARGIEVDLMK